MTFLASPYTMQISPVSENILANQTIALTVNAQLLGKGVKGVAVSWSSTSGALSAGNGSTNALGSAEVVFTPKGPGVSTITAILSHPILGTSNLTSSIITLPIPVKVRPSILQQLLAFPYMLGIVGAAIGVVIALLFVVRRRRKKGGETGEDSGFDLAVSAFPLGRTLLTSWLVSHAR
jgi:hypothetical protein